MNGPICVSCALALLALNAFGQHAAIAPNQSSLFSLPEPQLRPLTPQNGPEKIAQPKLEPDRLRLEGPTPEAQTAALNQQPSTSACDSLFGEAASNTRDAAFNLRVYRRLEDGGFLTRPPVKPDNLLDRGKESLANTFTPEVFHVGKTEWSCSILTAIKRRNPLCLLNPIVLNISW